jgi:hypothetical protein
LEKATPFSSELWGLVTDSISVVEPLIVTLAGLK